MSSLVSPKAERLFQQALELPMSERNTYLEDQCANDPDLLEEVQSLVESATMADDYFTDLADRFGLTSVLGGDAELPADERVGPYRLLRMIGRGGMGAVYLAERADQQYDQQVALKILPVGVGGEEARRRFFAERQILADLSHAHIARLLDGGITEQGTPYFVMEYVDGEPLDTYSDRRNLDVDARLDLFQQIGNAVQYAHRNLIVHRDLKPANVLVEKNGNVKLLDFGIAKALTADGHHVATRTGVMPMTSMYASPEMLLREPVTTLSDVYALGVLLYELLTGRHPYGLDTDASAPEVWRHVCEVEPLAPSKAVLRAAEPGSIAAARDTTPRRLSQRLTGDLDLVIAKAMHKDPDRRYGSVEQFLSDIENFRNGQPVLAQPPSVVYRVRKFAMRRKGVVVAGLAAVAMVAAMVYQSDRIAREAERANREADVAQQVSEFLVSVFTAADPAVASGDAMTALELLDQGAVELDSGSVEDPEVTARLKSTMAYVYGQLAAYSKAEELYNEAIVLQREHLGAEHPETLRTLMRMGLLFSAQGRFDEAVETLGNALVLQQRSLDEADPLTLDTMHNLAISNAQRGNFGEAVRIGETLLDLGLRSLGNGDRRTLRYMANLGIYYKLDGRWQDAEGLYQRALAGFRSIHDGMHQDTLSVMQNLADLYNDQERISEAEPLYEATIAGSKQIFGDEHPNVTRAMTNFGNMYQSTGEFEKAEDLYLDALRIQRATLGERHFETLNGMMKLGELYSRQQRFADADRLLRESLDGHRDVYGEGHRNTLGVLGRLQELNVMMGNDVEMLRLGRERLALWQALAEAPDASSQEKGSYGWNLATIRPESLREPEKAVAILTEVNQEMQFSEPRFLSALSVAHERAGELDAAIERLQQAIALLPDSADSTRSSYKERLARLLDERGGAAN